MQRRFSAKISLVKAVSRTRPSVLKVSTAMMRSKKWIGRSWTAARVELRTMLVSATKSSLKMNASLSLVLQNLNLMSNLAIYREASRRLLKEEKIASSTLNTWLIVDLC